MKERFRRFMQRRYGVDEFSRFLSGAGLVCMLIATVMSFLKHELPTTSVRCA